jgi:hypothetical protein
MSTNVYPRMRKRKEKKGNGERKWVLGDSGEHAVAPEDLGGEGEAQETDHEPPHESLGHEIEAVESTENLFLRTCHFSNELMN